MLQNAIAGLQGIIDHIMVGRIVGFTGNAAIGVSWQIFLVVIVFISSLYTGMGVLVARFAGANDEEKVNRVAYQAFLTTIILACGVMAPVGYFVSPYLLRLINAAPFQQTATPGFNPVAAGTGTWVHFTEGSHGSLLSPTNLAVTTEMQTHAASLAGSGGTVFAITNPAILETPGP